MFEESSATGDAEFLLFCSSIASLRNGERMSTDIQRDEVRRMIEGGAQLVEVLLAQEYEAEHVPGAINIPLKHRARQTTAQLQRDRPVIVYCYDWQ
jgi:rhodanese-related sulfurtransferase